MRRFSVGTSSVVDSTIWVATSLGAGSASVSVCGCDGGVDSASLTGKFLTDGTSCSDEIIDCAESSMG